MPLCRNDKKEMRIEGDKWVCDCDYQRDVVHKQLSHAEALEEIERLKEKFNKIHEALNNHCGASMELLDCLHDIVHD
ncbi:hypothetical protein LCGC14_0420150 [marine sediment metagenome]|uniref:Uncharacterized protein n=1 Tax=marine sediment metagenome TaxID=412755 RepID=A0A0F9VCZ7_9ZZZZ